MYVHMYMGSIADSASVEPLSFSMGVHNSRLRLGLTVWFFHGGCRNGMDFMRLF